MFKLLLIAPLAMLGACATLVNGTTQTVTVSTTPAAASCTLDRMGARVGAISATPGSVRLDKSKNDLAVTCSKDGFQTATVSHAPSFSGATFGNIIAGGVVGVIVNAASGANYSYPDDIRMDMAANPGASLPPIASQSGLDAPIRLRPVAAGPDLQSEMIRPIKASTVNGVGPTGSYPR